MTAMALDVRELTFEEIDWVSGGEGPIGAGPKEVNHRFTFKAPVIKSTPSAVLGVGAAITGLGAVVLLTVGLPALVPAAVAYGAVAGVMTLGSAMLAVAGS